MFGRPGLASCVIVSVCVLGAPAAIGAEVWLWPVGGEVTLDYGAAWVDGSGRSATHGGVDIGAACSAPVVAPAGGTVRFAGPVPGGAGRRVTAVTVATPDGLDYTCMPLEGAVVVPGQAVEAGVVLGSVAEAGDPSSAEPHVHLSVRRGSAHLDPATVLGERPGVAGGGSPRVSPPDSPPAPGPESPPPPVREAPASHMTGGSTAQPATEPAVSGPGDVRMDSRLAVALATAHATARHLPPVVPVKRCPAPPLASTLPWLRPASTFPPALAGLVLAALLSAPAWRRLRSCAPGAASSDGARELRVRA